MFMVQWTEKYKPERVSEIYGQEKHISEILNWINSWKPGKGLLISGPPGVGKTLCVEVIAKENSFELLRLNASDERSSEKIEKFLLDSSRTASLFGKGKIILLDEIDGISPQDRGAVNSIIKIIKVSNYPVILIANNPWVQKLRNLREYVKNIKFSKLRSASIQKKLKEICEKEGIRVEGNVLKNLSRWSQGDMRSAINDLQTIAEGKKEITDRDLEILGYRERESNIFEILPVIFKSRSLSASKKVIQSADKDPDEIFLWIENNIPLEIPKEKLPEVFDLISKADIFRMLVIRQQNWRFKGYMTDLMSGVSVIKGESHAPVRGFIPYQSPQRIRQMGRTKARREAVNNLCRKIGRLVHTSAGVARREYLPYLRILTKKKLLKPCEVLTEDDIKLILETGP
ncbi:MAG: replication factor C large subunit [Candidatus Aenigmatarchaeota archaeon]|nr:MAG: replication factor C large subunit [Candidatus Aenigmarchaeota archaeon]RLJ07519.1 MAG: replication factor C large subunit [Candidatus Aenigmarchaeota archaeon]